MQNGGISYVYIAGEGRSGSTLLGQILNNLPDFSFVGEFRHLFYERYGANYPCGCGRLFRDCGFWRSVMDGAFGSFDGIDRKALATCNFAVARERFTPLLMLLNRLPAELFSNKWRRAFEALMLPLCAAIVQASGRNVIVDSSHEPSQALVLARLPQIRLKVLHLVRDSRAVAFSSTRVKLAFEGGGERTYLPRKNAVTSALGWDWRNLWASRIAHLRRHSIAYARLRYEDLIRSPAEALAQTLSQARFPRAGSLLYRRRDGQARDQPCAQRQHRQVQLGCCDPADGRRMAPGDGATRQADYHSAHAAAAAPLRLRSLRHFFPIACASIQWPTADAE